MHRNANKLQMLILAGLLTLNASLDVAAQSPLPANSSAESKNEESAKRIEDFLKSLMLSSLQKPDRETPDVPSVGTTESQEKTNAKAKVEGKKTLKTSADKSNQPSVKTQSSNLTSVPSLLPPLDSMSLSSQLGVKNVCAKCGQPASGQLCSSDECKSGTGSSASEGTGVSSETKGSSGSLAGALAGQADGKNGNGPLPQQEGRFPSLTGTSSSTTTAKATDASSSAKQSEATLASNGADTRQSTQQQAFGALANTQGKNPSIQSQSNNLIRNGFAHGNIGTQANKQAAQFSPQSSVDNAILPQGFGGLPTDGNQLSNFLNMPVPINDPAIRGILDSASGVMVPPSWEIIRPAGVGAASVPVSLGMIASKVSGASEDQESKVLDGGTIKMAMQTGPQNPLVLPPDIASVVYVIDGSGSMTGGKFQRVSAALVDAVEQMKPDQNFSVICFNTLAIRAKGIEYRQASAEAASRLSSELNSITPVGGTDPTDAILIALQLRPETIVILSDGEFESQVIERVSHLNQSSGLNCQINCIAIGTSAGTLKRLAALNGPGNYVETK
jgi:hypothetical protein